MKKIFLVRLMVVVFILSLIFSVNGTAAVTGISKVDIKKPVDLLWIVRGSTPKNSDLVVEQANKITQKLINASLKMRFIEPGDYNTLMQITMAAGDNYDLCFTSNWANLYEPAVRRGAYVKLDSMINKFPEIKSIFKPEIWDMARVNDSIYGVPNNQIMVAYHGVWLQQSMVSKYKINYKNIKKLSDLSPILKMIHEKEPSLIPHAYAQPDNFIDTKYIQAPYAYIDTKTWKVTDDFQNIVGDSYQISRDWYSNGYFSKDVATIKDYEPLIKAGKVFSRYSSIKPGGEGELQAKYGYKFILVPLTTPTINAKSVTATLTAISVTSKNPERAMALISLMNTNAELFRTLTYGIKNVDYKQSGQKNIVPKKGNYTFTGWQLGNTFNGFVLPGQPAKVFEQTKALNEKAIINPASMISWDTSTILGELQQISAITQEYQSILVNGLDDPTKILKLRADKYKAAGSEKVKAVLQKQLDDWLKTKK